MPILSRPIGSSPPSEYKIQALKVFIAQIVRLIRPVWVFLGSLLQLPTEFDMVIAGAPYGAMMGGPRLFWVGRFLKLTIQTSGKLRNKN
jgi:hypothetical protein